MEALDASYSHRWHDPQDLTTTVWSLATMEHHDCRDFLALAMAKLRKQQLLQLYPQHMSNTFWALVTWRKDWRKSKETQSWLNSLSMFKLCWG